MFKKYHYYLITTKTHNVKTQKVEYRKSVIKTRSKEFPYSEYAKRFGSIYAVISCVKVDERTYNETLESVHYVEL